jgi:signal transduction histidine kinase
LFRNAIEHANPDVTVSVGTSDDGFHVADNGPGIPPGNRESVFEMGHSTSSDSLGLGLRIVKQVVEGHGWEIHVAKSVDGGARFEVTGVDFSPEDASGSQSDETAMRS